MSQQPVSTGSARVRRGADSAQQEDARPCQICRERANWDLLHNFYQREDTAHTYITKLNNSLCEATVTLEQARLTLIHCEAALVASWEKLGEERRAHQQDLDGAIQLVHQAVEGAKLSDHIAGSLECKVVELQAALDAKDAAQTRESPMEAPLNCAMVATPPFQRSRVTGFPVLQRAPERQTSAQPGWPGQKGAGGGGQETGEEGTAAKMASL